MTSSQEIFTALTKSSLGVSSKIFFNGRGVNLHYYRSNRVYSYKDELRKILSNKIKSVTTLNFLHSPDDEQESLDYLDMISTKDRKAIMSKFFLYCDKKKGG